MFSNTTEVFLAQLFVICIVCLIFAGWFILPSSGYISSNFKCRTYSSEHSRQAIPYHFMKEDYIKCKCLVILLLYIFRYPVASATMVFMNCCSTESLKFILALAGELSG